MQRILEAMCFSLRCRLPVHACMTPSLCVFTLDTQLSSHYVVILVICLIIASCQVKYGRSLRPHIAGPPSGTKELQLGNVCARGW